MSAGQKTPFGRSLNQLTQRKALDIVQQTGRSLPCHVVGVSGCIITVAFDINSGFTLPQVSVPLFGPEYIRYPIQIGDKGCVFAADAKLGGNSGLGGGVSDLIQPANLGSLVFFPFANKTWFAVDPQSVTIYGPNGTVLMDTGMNTVMTLTPSGISIMAQTMFQIVTGACSFVMDSSGTYSISGTTGTVEAATLAITDGAHSTSPTIMNAAWSAMVTYLNAHKHTSATAGSPTSAPITPFSGGNIAP